MIWKRIGLKELNLPEFKEYKNEFIPNVNGMNMKIAKTSIGRVYTKLDSYRGLGEDLEQIPQSNHNAGFELKVDDNATISEPLLINYHLDMNNPVLIDNNLIETGKNSILTLIFDYSSDDTIDLFHDGLTNITVNENATLNIIKIQRLNSFSHNFDTNILNIKDNGVINLINIELGAKITAINYTTYLNGENSTADLNSIYLGDGERKLDINYAMIHKGIRSVSNIESKGALKDNSVKVFRGTLEFLKGARHSKGSESEYTTLLSPSVKSDSIPALMCHEDDVDGNHAVSVGRIDENKLFYLQSRGLDEISAKKLIIESSFNPIIDKIPDENLKRTILLELERRI